MNLRHGFCQLMAKMLVFFMVIQGMPLNYISQAYVWEPDSAKISRILESISFGVSEAEAASITPGAFTSSIAQGQNITVQRTVTLDSGGPAANLVDVFFLADNTGSMGGFITTVRNNAQLILDAITGDDPRFAGIDVAFGVGYYRGDPREFGSSASAATAAYGLQQPITASISDVRAAINNWRASGGGDGPEANFFALHQVATSGAPTDGIGYTDGVFSTAYNTGWRPNAARVIVWFGDYWSHTTTVDIDEAIAALQANNVTVAAINTRPSTTGINGYGQAAAIVAATHGTLTNNVTGTDATINAILNAVEAATATVDLTLDTRGDTSGLTIDFSCVSPEGCQDVPPGGSRTFDMSITGNSLGTYQFEVFAPHVTGAVAQDNIIVRPCINNLTVRTKSEKAQLVWTDTGADHYVVYRSLTSGGPYDRLAETRSRYSTYLDYGLTDGTTYYYLVREADAAGNEYCETVEVSALPGGRIDTRPPNQAPEITSTPITEATQGELYSYDAEASDPNGDTLAFSLDIAPDGMIIDSASGLIQWTPANHHVGSHQVVVRVQDPAGLLDTQLFSITVANVNDAPVIVSTPPSTVRVNETYVYTINAIDPDLDDTLTFHLLQGPSGMTIDESLGQIQWTPAAAQVGMHDVSVQAVDNGGLAATQLFSINVTEVNRTPSIISSPVTAVLLGSSYVYNVEATDPNTGDTLGYSLLQAPDGMTIDENTGLIQWTPLESQLGSHPVEIRVEDSGGLTDTQSFSVDVALPDLPPEITSAEVVTASEGIGYSYDVDATDPNPGDTVTYSLDAAPAGMAIDPVSGLIQWTPTEEQVGLAAVTVRVTDSTGLSATQVFSITVANIQDPPVITSVPVLSATFAVLYAYDVDATDPDVGETLTYGLLQAPSTMTIDTDTGLISWTPQLNQVGSNGVEVQVTDSTGLTATQDFVVEVILPELPPEITSAAVMAATEGELYTYDVEAIDLNPGDTIIYSLDAAPAGMAIDAASGLIQWTPTEEQVGLAAVTVRVTDSTGLSATQAFSITILNIQDPPVITSMPVTTATVEMIYSYDVEATDPDNGETLTFSLEAAPVGMTIDPVSGLIQWTPLETQAGTCNVIARVTDSTGLFANQTFEIAVEQIPNEPPAITSTAILTADIGTPYNYPVAASDPEGDSLTYSLDVAPAGMTIDSSSGLVQWNPTQPQMGSQPVTIRVTDANGLFATQNFTVQVFSPPTAAFSYSGILTRLESVSFNGSLSADPDGGAISSWHWDFGDGASSSGVSTSHAYTDAGSYTVTLTVTDDEGAFASVSQALNIAEIMVVAPDVVGLSQSAAESSIVSAQLAVGAITTQNSDTVPAGQVISQQPAAGASLAIGSPIDLAVSIGPLMVSVPNVTGMMQSEAASAIAAAGLLLGTVTPQMDLTVPEGQVLGQSPASGITVPLNSTVNITVAVQDDTVAPQVGVSLSANPIRPGQYTQISVTATDNIGLSVTSLTVDGVTVPLDSNNKAFFQAAAEGTLAVTAQAQDLAGNIGTASIDLIVNDTGDNAPPAISLTYSPSNPAVGDTIEFNISASDDFGVDPDRMWLKVDGIYVPVENGQAAYVANRQGSIPAVASVYDLSGNYAQDAQTISVSADGTNTAAPSAVIVSPVDEQEVLGVVDVVGTANDGDLAYYTLSYRADGESSFVEYYRNDQPVTNGVLGVFDGTMLENGSYTIELRATDIYGASMTDTVQVYVSGDQKLGNFTLSFTDMHLDVSGIDLEVVRTYDSRVKTKRDFGVGWSLDIRQSMKLRENVEPGTGWETYCTRSLWGTCLEYGVRRSRDHYITIYLPGYHKQEFEVNSNISYADSSGIAQGSLTFSPLLGTHSTLEPLDNTTFDFLMGGNLLDMDFNLIDPNRYRLTLPDGTQYYYNQNNNAIYRIVDANGNSVDIASNGITHSTGAQVVFTRDGDGRITSIEGNGDQLITYSYDGLGNLTVFTDANGNETRFKYAADHYLNEIIDPRGISALRSEYDDAGRLIRQINPEGEITLFEYDLETHTVTVTDPNGEETELAYNDNGNITSSIDALGNESSYAYDGDGNLFTETDALGNIVKAYTYDERDNKLSEADGEGNTTYYSYNAMNKVTSIIDPNGNETTFTYDGNGNRLTETDAAGRTTTFTYDANGNKTSMTDYLGRTTIFENDSHGNIIRQVDALGNEVTSTYNQGGMETSRTVTRTTGSGVVAMVTRKTYDRKGNLLSVVYPDGLQTRYEYSPTDKKIAEIDRSGNRTEYEYDANDKLVVTRYPDGTTSTNSYDAVGNRVAVTDRQGRTTNYTYDDLDRVVSTILPNGFEKQTEYNAAGLMTANIDAQGNRTTYAYDRAGRKISVTDALGHVTSFGYDGNGNQVTMTDANGNTYQYEYNEQDKLTRLVFPDGTDIQTEYDGFGNKISETDQAGNTTLFEYDAANRLIKVIDALSGETVYSYDEVGNKLTQTDANGNTQTWTYTDQGKASSHTLAMGQTEYFTYDASGNILTHTDFNGNTTTYSYDVCCGRLLSKTFEDGSSVTYTYTPGGLQESVTDNRGVTQYDYDSLDRLVQVTNPDGSRISYAYDANNNRTEVITAAGSTHYSYDAVNRLMTVTDAGAGVTVYSYDAKGNRTSVTYPNGIVTQYTYDQLDRLINLENRNTADNVISSYAYTLSANGNRLQVQELSGRSVLYDYDALNRLVEEAITDSIAGDNLIAYSYDSVGNRLSKTDTSGTISYSYNENNQLVSEAGAGRTYTYSYDANGNTIGKSDGTAVVDYFYNDENRLVGVQSGAAITSYVYDPDGIRVQSTTDGFTSTYLVDKNRDYAQVIEERDGSGALVVSYTFGDDLISQRRGGAMRYYLYDGQMSTRQLTDDAQTVTDAYTYDAFGLVTGQDGSTPNNYLYSGEQYDPNAGFYYLRARYYNQQIGRFVSVDPWQGNIHDPVTLHKYIYANANPATYNDPSGMFSLGGLMIGLAIRSLIVSVTMVGSGFLAGFIAGKKPLNWSGSITIATVSITPNPGWGPGVGLLYVHLNSECRNGKRAKGRYAILLPFGMTVGGPFGNAGPNYLPSITWAFLKMKSPGIFGASYWPLAGPAFFASASYVVGGGYSATLLMMGFGIGYPDFTSPGSNWALGHDIGIDFMGGYSVPIWPFCKSNDPC